MLSPMLCCRLVANARWIVVNVELDHSNKILGLIPRPTYSHRRSYQTVHASSGRTIQLHALLPTRTSCTLHIVMISTLAHHFGGGTPSLLCLSAPRPSVPADHTEVRQDRYALHVIHPL